MFAIIGMVVVIGMIIAGYLMEHGNLHVLWQPAELVIIFGASFGSFLIMSPGRIVKVVLKNIANIFKNTGFDKQGYIELLVLLNELFRKIRKEGLLVLEADVNDPHNSASFKDFKRVMANHHVLEFICANFKVIISSNISHHDLENLMEIDMEASHHEAALPGEMVTKVADALPGLGIVAAVLGVVITMGMISEPPEVLGHSIGAALVGTFLGVLACYGFVGPIATNLEMQAKDEAVILTVIKAALVSSVSGAAPQTAVEYGRRAIPGDNRPSLTELEEAINQWSPKP